jgi:[protein-PII] uridylyltransferase
MSESASDSGAVQSPEDFASHKATLVSRWGSDDPASGTAFCAALSTATDQLLRYLFTSAMQQFSPKKAVALVAVGGYGRGEMAPYSDLDVLLLHEGEKTIDEFASALWYPLWDLGLKVGHAVRTPKETRKLGDDDLDTSTALVTSRWVAGDEKLAQAVIDEARERWRQRGRDSLKEVHRRVLERHATAGEVAFLLEPNLKEGLGGLRDIHALWWAVEAGLVLSGGDKQDLRRANEVLLTTRVALHRLARRAGDVLRLEDQDAVATLVGCADADALMADVAAAGRKVAWIADEAWARIDPPSNAGDPPRKLAPGVELRAGEVHLDDTADPEADPTLVLRVATAAARLGARIERESLNRLGASTPVWPDPWPAGARDDFVALMLEGERAIPVLESLDQRDLISKVLPEWQPVRSKPQRNAYHRFTVDRHLWQTVANAAALAERVSRADLLMLGAWFHDLGKGYPGDHTEVGVELFGRIGPRMGLSPDDVDIVSALIEHHLLLPDTATRRDLSDDATITGVADAVKSSVTLELLCALTEADSKATGSSAWSDWKASLVYELTERVDHVLGGGDVAEVTWKLFPDADVLEMMASGRFSVGTSENSITVVTPDQMGTFSKVAGVLALHGLDVLGAEAHSDEQGMAASEFRVQIPEHGEIEWARVRDAIERALRNELALEARLAERAETYKSRRVLTAIPPSPPKVRFDDAASSNSTLLEVRAPDKVGILHNIAKTIADMGLDIRHARVQTIGNEVVDTFYVRTSAGEKVSDTTHRAEVTRALLHAVSK